jgi:hypothetical protein
MRPGCAADERPQGSNVFLARSFLETQRSGHRVAGRHREGTIVTEGERPQPYQCVGDAHVELGGYHAGGLVHHIVEVGTPLQLRRQGPGALAAA